MKDWKVTIPYRSEGTYHVRAHTAEEAYQKARDADLDAMGIIVSAEEDPDINVLDLTDYGYIEELDTIPPKGVAEMGKAEMGFRTTVGFLKYDDGTIGVNVLSAGTFEVGEYGLMTGSVAASVRDIETIEDAKQIVSQILEEHINRVTTE